MTLRTKAFSNGPRATQSGGATGRQRSEGKADVAIIALEPLAIECAETVHTRKPAIVLAAVFIFVEAILLAETVSVILLKEVDLRNPGAVLIALLLSMALLGNFVCGMVAARAAGFVRQSEHSKHVGAGPISDWFAVVSGSHAAIGCAAGADIAGVDLAAPASASAM
jgi:hypothetical protein